MPSGYFWRKKVLFPVCRAPNRNTLSSNSLSIWHIRSNIWHVSNRFYWGYSMKIRSTTEDIQWKSAAKIRLFSEMPKGLCCFPNGASIDDGKVSVGGSTSFWLEKALILPLKICWNQSWAIAELIFIPKIARRHFGVSLKNFYKVRNVIKIQKHCNFLCSIRCTYQHSFCL